MLLWGDRSQAHSSKLECSLPVDQIDVIGEKHTALSELLGSMVPVGSTLHSFEWTLVLCAGSAVKLRMSTRSLEGNS